MIIKIKHTISSFLVLVFMSGLVHEPIINYLDDSAIVFELEGHDNQNDSESSFDEDIVELGIIEEHSLFIRNKCH